MRLLLRHDWKVGYFSPENTPLAYHYRKLIRRVVGKRFEHKGMPLPEAGQAIRYLAQSVFSIMPKEDFSVESVLRIAAQLVSRKGVKVLVVDPFNRFEHQIPDWETETQYISRIFDEFSNFAVKHKVLLIWWRTPPSCAANREANAGLCPRCMISTARQPFSTRRIMEWW